jgi:hypothetical protein
VSALETEKEISMDLQSLQDKFTRAGKKEEAL